MSKAKIIWLIVAVALIVVGAVSFVWAMSANGWDFTKLSTAKYVTNTYELDADFENISINTNTADVIFLPSDSEQGRVVCYEADNERHTVTATGGTLTVRVVKNKAWYDYIGFNFDTPKLTVYLPKSEYGRITVENNTGDVSIPKSFGFVSMDIATDTGDVRCDASVLESLKIETDTGDVNLATLSAGSVSVMTDTGDVGMYSVNALRDVGIETDTGKVALTGVNCKSVVIESDTGDVSLESVIATNRFSIDTDTGDVALINSDAAEIFIETETGDVTGSLLSGKTFVTDSDTGDISVPASVTGGRCEIITDTGDITVRVNQ
ncbi:MAG: DUF4097 family beta strand repeat protein [Clostridia bacterium]|nr:DUF4097 family beta strand repeat protein [Clostridia bacterium]